MRVGLNTSQVKKIVELMSRTQESIAGGNVTRCRTGSDGAWQDGKPRIFRLFPDHHHVRVSLWMKSGGSADDLAREYKNAPELVVVEKASDLPFEAPDDAKGARCNGRCFLSRQ